MGSRIGRAAVSGVLLLGLTGCGTAALAGAQSAGPAVRVRASAAVVAPTGEPTAPTPGERPPTETVTMPTPVPGNTARPTPIPTPTVAPTPSPAATPPASPTANTPPALLKANDTLEKVRELQVRLAQLNWFDGTITDHYGDTTQAGVEGFQAKRGFAPTGQVDQRTWDTLVAMTATPTRDQMYNVLRPGPALLKTGATGDTVRDLQARLKQIGWYAPAVTGSYDAATIAGVRDFQAKRQIPVTGEVDQRTSDRLAAMTRVPTSWELKNQPPPATSTTTEPLDARCLSGRVLCISKTSDQLRWVVEGKVLLTVDVRFGSSRTPTREGAFSVGWKSRDHVSTIYDSKMPFAMFFSGGQAVHYSSDFAARGYQGASHGCVNVRDHAAIKWLYDQVRVGDAVIVYR